MAEKVINEEEEKKGKSGGDGNRNALAYGLLQGAGYNTTGMSPSDAWAMVDALKLMDREARKKPMLTRGAKVHKKTKQRKAA